MGGGESGGNTAGQDAGCPFRQCSTGEGFWDVMMAWGRCGSALIGQFMLDAAAVGWRRFGGCPCSGAGVWPSGFLSMGRLGPAGIAWLAGVRAEPRTVCHTRPGRNFDILAFWK
ncbi:unnamed protein product [Ostreobium quekettii]|uniref:Uncharacterized protein n=1 Tax=Ostreobium quekettii TaxID=121088 RepID=A0A8S1IXL0_9CHLO|nr:unnamed protein product [Ostreobium quekettii]